MRAYEKVTYKDYYTNPPNPTKSPHNLFIFLSNARLLKPFKYPYLDTEMETDECNPK